MQIVVLDAKTLKVEELDLAPWRALGTLSLYDRTDPVLVPQRLRGADVVLTNKVRLTAEALKGASSLKMIGVLATGYDVVDTKAARALGIPVCNVPGYATGSVTESVFGFLLEMTRHTAFSTGRIRQGAWTACPEFCWWERTPAFPGKQVPLEELLAASDVISLHCPATAENMGFINAETIAQMKDGVLLINTARGSLVNEMDVAAALVSGKLGGYGADVVSREPIDIHNPLLKAPNCYLTGHSAWATVEARQKIVDVTADSIRGMLEDKPVNVVN